MFYEEFLKAFFDQRKEKLNKISNEEIKILNDYFASSEPNKKADISDNYIIDIILLDNNYNRLKNFFNTYGNLSSEFLSDEKLLHFDSKQYNNFEEDVEYLKEILEAVQRGYNRCDSILKIAVSEASKPYNLIIGIVEKYTKRLSTSLDESKNTYNKAQKAYNKSEHLFKEAEKNVEGLVSNMLTVLGIFVSIVVAVLIVYITVFLDKGNNSSLFFTNTPQLNLLKYVLTIHLLGNFVFMFLFFIAKLTNRTLMSSCVNFLPLQNKNEPEKEELEENRYLLDDKLEKQKPCTRCAYACSSYRIIVNRLFHVLLFNGAMLFFYDCLYVWWYVVHLYELDIISLWLIAKEPYFLLFILLLSLNVIFIIMIKQFIINKPNMLKNNCPCKKTQKKHENG